MGEVYSRDWKGQQNRYLNQPDQHVLSSTRLKCVSTLNEGFLIRTMSPVLFIYRFMERTCLFCDVWPSTACFHKYTWRRLRRACEFAEEVGATAAESCNVLEPTFQEAVLLSVDLDYWETQFVDEQTLALRDAECPDIRAAFCHRGGHLNSEHFTLFFWH
jgi:hypothetical protein